jgi:hypothetical protein
METSLQPMGYRQAPKAFAVPRDHGFWFHDVKRRPPVRPNTREPNPEKTIKGQQLESPFLVPPLENEKLMAQGEDFCLQSNSRTERITKSGEEENQDREASPEPIATLR